MFDNMEQDKNQYELRRNKQTTLLYTEKHKKIDLLKEHVQRASSTLKSSFLVNRKCIYLLVLLCHKPSDDKFLVIFYL